MDLSAEKSAQNAKRTKKRLAVIIVSAVVLISAMIILFVPTRVSVDEMYSSPDTFVSGDKYSMRYFITDGGGQWRGALSDYVLVDENLRCGYYYKFVYFSCSRFNRYFAEGETVDYGFSSVFNVDDLPQNPKELDENPGLIESYCVRYYYVDPDGSFTLLWEHPDARTIESRCGAELGAPENHIVKRKNDDFWD